ncbi:aromatic ring-hydroxylating oxygenase subunit alpha [Collimonas humicola]|uniref:aromatic ring-hydroxylating oxygenase subunit alpha n=1 Tax=Collimonas humicola TaxID=2825886 RepID=UPI001B8B829D|nr:aromatic ring-hydroxylating dioxygenase subunit alpha [Collimonas humicola]
MISEMQARHYIAPEIFEREQQRLFGKLWIFAGVRTLLDQPNAFLTRTIAGIPLVIQNMTGTLKAFDNQCAHRQMPLQFEEYGQRRLACRYHGWTYDGNGCAKSIPDEQVLYRFDAEQRASLCLREFAVEVIGNLVFVNVDENPIPIDQQFTEEFRTQLAGISSHFSSQAIHTRVPASYNWKLNFENVLDWNHVAHVHPRSFQPLLGAAATEPVPHAPDVANTALSSLSFSSSTQMNIRAWPWHAMTDAYGAENTYHNFFIYPNVNFISIGGVIFTIQQFDPFAADRTELRLTLMSAREKQRIAAMPAILWSHLKSEKRVIDEDKVLLEMLQTRLHAGGRAAYHGAYETRLRRVADVYLRLMGEKA